MRRFVYCKENRGCVRSLISHRAEQRQALVGMFEEMMTASLACLCGLEKSRVSLREVAQNEKEN